jgi:hypothetical protein
LLGLTRIFRPGIPVGVNRAATEFDPGGLIYPNSRAVEWALAVAGILFVPAIIVYFARGPGSTPQNLFPWTLAVGICGASLGALYVGFGLSHVPTRIRITNEGIVAYFGWSGPFRRRSGSYEVRFSEILQTDPSTWKVRPMPRGVGLEYQPNCIRFVKAGVLKGLRMEPSDPNEGGLYVTRKNLLRVRAACSDWREGQRQSMESLAIVQNEMDEKTAKELGEV